MPTAALPRDRRIRYIAFAAPITLAKDGAMSPTTLITRPTSGEAHLPARFPVQLPSAAEGQSHATALAPATEPVRQLGVLNGVFLEGLVRGLGLSDVLPGAALQEFASEFRA